jgi:hypothetical protein
MSTPNPFVRASSSELFSPSKHPEWMNKLFIVRPNYVEMVTFKPEDGPKKVVNAHVVILDLIGADGMPTVIGGAAIGGAGIVPQIENHINEAVLGRLVMGQPQPGKNPAFKLETNFTDADAELAGRYIQQFPLPPAPSAPAPAPAQAPQAPFGGPAAPAAGQWGATPQAPAQQQFSPPPADVWGGVNAAPAPQAAAPAWGQAPAQQPPAAAPAQWQAPAPAAPPAPAQQQWGQPDPMAGAQQWGNTNQPAPAVAQDQQLVAFLQSKGIDVAPNGVPMGNDQMRMIASTIPQ